MEFRRKVRGTRRANLLASTILAAMVVASSAWGADQEAPVFKAVPEIPGWYYYGGFEAGGRYVFDRPPSGFGFTPASSGGLCTVGGASVVTQCFLTASQTQSRAKFEEYGQVPTAPFLDWINLQAGTTDGRYAYDFWGRSVGLNNQTYQLDAAKVGEHYLSIGWDQTPHLISTSAKTVFGGVGSTFLTVNPALPLALAPFLGTAPTDAASRDQIQAIINDFEHPLTLSTRRDRASVGYWWTPNPDWDFAVEYDATHRTGVQPVGLAHFFDTTNPPVQHYPIEVPAPIKDTTHNVEAKAERAGTSFWGMRWTSNVAYHGSFYRNDLKQLDAQNPFCDPSTCNVFTGPFFAPNDLRLGLDPSNNANAVTWNTAADLPFWKARYVSTLQFNDMRQNDPFIDTGTNGLIAPPVTLNGVPVGSLNGVVDTLLWNNVLTMRPTKELKLTLRGRHYAIDNNTPSLHIEDWVTIDTSCASAIESGIPIVPGACNGGSGTRPRNSLPIAYTKDNASAEASWNPVRPVTLGGGWFWERWDRKFRDVDVTNENTGKVFIDFVPAEYVHARGSYLFAERRYETYDTALFVLAPGLFADQFASNLRRFDVANRNRQKADVQVDIAPTDFLTISPNFGLRWDDYPDSVLNPLGLRSNHSWNVGVEIGAAINSRIKVMAAYNFEDSRLRIAGGNGNSGEPPPQPDCPTDLTNTFNPVECTWFSNMEQRYHTFMVAADVKVVPAKFDLRFEAIHTIATEKSHLTPCAAGTGCNGLNDFGLDPAAENFGQFPTVRNNFERFNVIAKYYVDPNFVRQMGWVGDVVIKARYTFEHNHMDNWAINNVTPFVSTPDTQEEGGGRALFLAALNPNYTAQIVALSAVVKW
jgi:MtrB/PioB family decaheme-associated outer membrane protein